MAWINPAIGKSPSSPEILATAEKNSEGMVSVVEKALAGKQYLVGDQLTIADLFVVAAFSRGYQLVSPPVFPTRLQLLKIMRQLTWGI